MKLDVAGGLLLSYGVLFTAPIQPLKKVSLSSKPSVGSSGTLEYSSFFVPNGKTARNLRAPSTVTMRVGGSGGAWGPLGALRSKFGRDKTPSSESNALDQAGSKADDSVRRYAEQQGGAEGGMQQLVEVAGGGELELSSARKEEPPKKVLILMSDTGGGHRASAKALADAFDELYPGQIHCDIVDIWTENSCWPYNRVVPFYKFAAKHTVVWRFFYAYGVFKPTRWLQQKITLRSVFKHFKACLAGYDPDLVLSVHPLCQDIPLRALKSMGGGTRQVPFVTVVTDLGGAHPTWFDKRADLCFVPSEPIKAMAHKAGLSEAQLRQYGLPLRRGFWNPEKRSKDEVREALGLKAGLPTALVVAGGDGVGGIMSVADALGQELARVHQETQMESQIVVVTGSNQKAKAQLEAEAEAQAWGKGVSVSVQGFVSNMEEFMAAADCIVTKAGPGTIAEAMCRGLPTMLSCYLPGQEAGNVPFVTQGGFGDYQWRNKHIAKGVAEWMKDPSKLEAMSAAAAAAGRPSATYDIARDIADLVFQTPAKVAAAATA